WNLLERGGDAVTDMPLARRKWIGLAEDDAARLPGAYLDDVDRFDARFFGISAREAKAIDPQHRLLLEVAWEALESAAHAQSSSVAMRTGVFVGITTSDCSQLLRRQYGADAASSAPYFALGNALN